MLLVLSARTGLSLSEAVELVAVFAVAGNGQGTIAPTLSAALVAWTSVDRTGRGARTNRLMEDGRHAISPTVHSPAPGKALPFLVITKWTAFGTRLFSRTGFPIGRRYDWLPALWILLEVRHSEDGSSGRTRSTKLFRLSLSNRAVVSLIGDGHPRYRHGGESSREVPESEATASRGRPTRRAPSRELDTPAPCGENLAPQH